MTAADRFEEIMAAHPTDELGAELIELAPMAPTTRLLDAAARMAAAHASLEAVARATKDIRAIGLERTLGMVHAAFLAEIDRRIPPSAPGWDQPYERRRIVT